MGLTACESFSAMFADTPVPKGREMRCRKPTVFKTINRWSDLIVGTKTKYSTASTIGSVTRRIALIGR
jgi:hypothetical protein